MTEHLPQLLRASLWGVAGVGPGRAVPNQGSSQAGRLWAQWARGAECRGGCGSRKLGLSHVCEFTHGTDRLDLSSTEQCGDKAPDSKGLCQGDPSVSGFHAPCRSWGDSQGPVSQCMGQKRGQCGRHRSGRPAGRSGGCSTCVGSACPFPTDSPPVTRQGIGK